MQKILQLCERHAFAKPVFLNDSFCFMNYGAAGELMKKFLLNEWLNSNVISTEISIFPHCLGRHFTGEISRDLKDSYDYVKNLCSGQLPFGIAVEAFSNFEAGKLHKDHEMTEERKFFCPLEYTSLKTYIFVSPSKSTQFFYQWQRQRKMWWRKFSASPGRFVLSDFQNTDEGQTVNVHALFPWGLQEVETVKHWNRLNCEPSVISTFEAKDGRKKVLPHVIESSLALEPAIFVFMCDAYDESTVIDLPREVMRFHRKLAPYKVSFSATASSASVAEELSQLAAYLTKQLRTAGISTLLLPDVVKRSMESNFMRCDELGIPYTVVLNDGTLKTGIVGLRSRDTTLKEQVHIIKLREYMQQILKNY